MPRPPHRWILSLLLGTCFQLPNWHDVILSTNFLTKSPFPDQNTNPDHETNLKTIPNPKKIYSNPKPKRRQNKRQNCVGQFDRWKQVVTISLKRNWFLKILLLPSLLINSQYVFAVDSCCWISLFRNVFPVSSLSTDYFFSKVCAKFINVWFLTITNWKDIGSWLLLCVVYDIVLPFVQCRWSRIFNSQLLCNILVYSYLYFNVFVVALLVLFVGKLLYERLND